MRTFARRYQYVNTVFSAFFLAHFRHNIPYEGFIALDERYQSGCAELDRHYNGWDVHATRTIKLSDSYLEMYGTIVDILTERSDGSEAPIVFTKFQDVDMVKECLTWLRNNAMEEAEDYGMLKGMSVARTKCGHSFPGFQSVVSSVS